MAWLKRKAQPSEADKETKTMAPSPFGERSPEQIKAALAKAAEARAAKTETLRQIRSGEISLADMFSEDYKDNERIQRLQIGSAMRALPGVTQYRAAKILRELDIDAGRRVKGVGARQRERLLAALSAAQE